MGAVQRRRSQVSFYGGILRSFSNRSRMCYFSDRQYVLPTQWISAVDIRPNWWTVHCSTRSSQIWSTICFRICKWSKVSLVTSTPPLTKAKEFNVNSIVLPSSILSGLLSVRFKGVADIDANCSSSFIFMFHQFFTPLHLVQTYSSRSFLFFSFRSSSLIESLSFIDLFNVTLLT